MRFLCPPFWNLKTPDIDYNGASGTAAGTAYSRDGQDVGMDLGWGLQGQLGLDNAVVLRSAQLLFTLTVGSFP